MSVDESAGTRPAAVAPIPVLCFGVLVPKRHARRAVTRSLLKREMRAGLARQADRLAPGWWLLRLRSPFDAASFRSAASSALRNAARAEIESLLADVAERRANH